MRSGINNIKAAPHLKISSGVLLQQRLKLLLQFCLCCCTYKLVYNLTVLDEQYCRNVADAKLHGDVVVLLYVAFTNNDLAFVLVSQLLNDRCDGTARTTPCSPEINY